MTPLSLAAMATTPGTSPESAARWSTWSICFVMVTLPPGWLSADGIPLTARSPPGDIPQAGDWGLPSLDGLLGGLVNLDEVLGLGGIRRWQVPAPVRLLLLSSGTDLATFGDAYSSRFTLADGAGADASGLGTYAASV